MDRPACRRPRRNLQSRARRLRGFSVSLGASRPPCYVQKETIWRCLQSLHEGREFKRGIDQENRSPWRVATSRVPPASPPSSPLVPRRVGQHSPTRSPDRLHLPPHSSSSPASALDGTRAPLDLSSNPPLLVPRTPSLPLSLLFHQQSISLSYIYRRQACRTPLRLYEIGRAHV